MRWMFALNLLLSSIGLVLAPIFAWLFSKNYWNLRKTTKVFSILLMEYAKRLIYKVSKFRLNSHPRNECVELWSVMNERNFNKISLHQLKNKIVCGRKTKWNFLLQANGKQKLTKYTQSEYCNSLNERFFLYWNNFSENLFFVCCEWKKNDCARNSPREWNKTCFELDVELLSIMLFDFFVSILKDRWNRLQKYAWKYSMRFLTSERRGKNGFVFKVSLVNSFQLSIINLVSNIFLSQFYPKRTEFWVKIPTECHQSN